MFTQEESRHQLEEVGVEEYDGWAVWMQAMWWAT